MNSDILRTVGQKKKEKYSQSIIGKGIAGLKKYRGQELSNFQGMFSLKFKFELTISELGYGDKMT